MLLWCKPGAVKSANALWLDVGRFRSNSAGDPTNLQHATTDDDHHNSFEIDSQQFWVQQSLSKVYQLISINFVIFFLSYWGDVFLDEQVFYLAPNVFSSLDWLSHYHNFTVKLQFLLTSKYEKSIVSTELQIFFAMLTSFVNMNLKKLLQTWKDQGRPANSS